MRKLRKVKFRFTKYQACGNDFVLVDQRHGTNVFDKEKPIIAKKLCNRHFGIGADGVLFVKLSEKADAEMQLFDREDREAFMCGNGIRCIADYLYSKLTNDKMWIDTRDGLKEIARIGPNLYRVNMGKLRLRQPRWKFPGKREMSEKLSEAMTSLTRKNSLTRK